MASKVTIYSTTEPGVHIERHQIDANECVQRGGWSFTPVDVKPTKPVYTEPSAEEVAVEPVPLDMSAELEAQLDAAIERKTGTKPAWDESSVKLVKPAQPKSKPGRKPKSA